MGSAFPVSAAEPRVFSSPIPARWVASVVREPGRRPELRVAGGTDGSPRHAVIDGVCALLFDGSLYNRADLERELGLGGAHLDDAAILARGYARWGRDLIGRIKGLFAVVVLDSVGELILAARDPLGSFPLFMTDAPSQVLFATCVDTLRRQPGVNGAINRAALADHLNRRWPTHHETFFAGVRRVPPGTLFQWKAGQVTTTRYWNPAPAGEPIRWVREEDLQAEFDFRFEQAVSRAMQHGRSGIFLSGGLDSISVAAMATGAARQQQVPQPLALSLAFPGDINEEREQRGVARGLGLDQELVPFDEAVARGQMLSLGLEITKARSAPLLNAWQPAYCELARRGKDRGVRAILSGAGGDEWLTVTPLLAADLLLSGDVSSMARLISVWQRSYNLSLPASLHLLLWKFGVRPLVSAALGRVAPQAWTENRVARGEKSILPWLAPDKTLQDELHARVRRFLPSPNPPRSFYLADVESSLEHPLTSMELEEIFEMGHDLQVRFLHPYWDADLADLLYRTPPMLLFGGGRAKGLVRNAMAARFPGLDLERQKKRAGTAHFGNVLRREVPELWKQHGDLSALVDLRVVDFAAASKMADRALRSVTDSSTTKSALAARSSLVRLWDLMNVETWVRGHQ